MKKEFKQLIALQDKDTAIDVAKAKVEAVPALIEEQKNLLAGIKAAFEQSKQNMTRLTLAKKEKEMEVSTVEAAIGKHSGELNAVKSNDAYKALLSEIEKEKQKKYSLEDEILAVMEDMEKESLAVKAKEKEAREKEGEVAAIIAKLTAEHKAGLDSICALEAERAEFAKHINENIMSKYDYIRNNRGGSALVEIVGGNCGGCHFELRQATINEASKGGDFVFCDSCSRILYKKPE